MKYLLIVLVFCIWSCNTNYKSQYYKSQEVTDIRCEIKEKKLPPNCKGVNQLIAEQWFYDNRSKHYINDYMFTSILTSKYKTCLRELSFDEIKQVLGLPTYDDVKNGNGLLCYYTDISYLNKKPLCNGISIYIKDYKVESVGNSGCFRDYYKL